ncbi:hypothetical protein LPJ56_000936 [Coemansia sp. RSA 2599]|nr:hypothetical protein LPJ75_000526 [Coemansia sp. RSA 2598]KAJ1828711.1 hypothetical protein LPJ56_000936 [Coemansia sp. RSA 2599]
MSESAYIGNPEELAKFTATTTSAQFPAAISPIDLLCPFSTAEAPRVESNKVLVTVQGEGVQIYSTTDSKCLRSWTFPPSVRFACPAKYLPKYNSEGEITDSFVYAALDSGEGVSDANRGAVVWRWTDKGMQSVGVEDRIDVVCSSPILSLETGVTPAGHLLAIHRNGSLTLSTQELQSVHELKLPVAGSPEVIWYQLIEVSQSMRAYLDSRQAAEWLANSSRLALIVTRAADEEISGAFVHFVSLVVVDANESTIADCGTTRISPNDLAAQPLAIAFDADTGVLAVLTETGSYIQFSLSMGSSALDDAILVERTKEVVLRGFVPCASDSSQRSFVAPNLLTQSQLSLISLTEKYVAIAGTHSTMSHSSTGPYESVLTLWDLQYGCMHAEKKLPVALEHLSHGGPKSASLPRLAYQIQTLGPRLNKQGMPSDQVSLAITVAHTSAKHLAFDDKASVEGAHAGKKTKKAKSPALPSVSWDIETYVTSAYLPPVTLLASLRLQNNAKYFVDPVEQSTRVNVVHSSNILLHEEQEQGLGVLRSGWEAITDGTVSAPVSTKNKAALAEAFQAVSERREKTQRLENEVLLALANVSDAVDSDQYTLLFMDHIGVKDTPDAAGDGSEPVWVSAHLMTTVMRRCFAEPLGVSRSSRLPLFAPRVIKFMLVNCGLCNLHAPAPGLLPHLLARVDSKRCKMLTEDAAWNLIDLSLRRCPDLPERHVADVLRFQLAHYAQYIDRMFVGDASQTSNAMDDDAVEQAAADVMRVVGAIAAIPANSDALRFALSTLSLDQVACVLRLAIIWLREWTLMGANVEISASANVVAASNAALAQELFDEDDGKGSSQAIALEAMKTTIRGAQKPAPASFSGIPTVDASTTLFVAPPATPAQGAESSIHINHVFTRKWAPQLVLPTQLMSAPTLDQVVEFVSSVLDAHNSKLVLTDELHGLVGQLKEATEAALSVSEQLKLLRGGLLPFHSLWEKQQKERAAQELAQQKVELGLDEVVMPNGMTRSQAERKADIRPNAKIAQGAGSSGTYWERVQKHEKYRVEVMHWE